jgi:hypothetical protein
MRCFLIAWLVLSAPSAAPEIETAHLIATLSVSGKPAAPGSRVSLFIDVSPKAKMHVYAPAQKDYMAVTLILQPNRAYRALPPVFPKPEKYFFAPLKETQLVYSKPFRIVQDVTLASASVLKEASQAGAATVVIAGTLRYQACDDAICYLPKDVPVSWTVKLKNSQR